MSIMQIRQLLFAVAALCLSALASAETYTYDALNRLTAVDYGNGTTIAYTYDAAGNRLSSAATSVALAPAEFTLSPKNLTFALQAVGSSSEAKTVALSNTGGTAGTISGIAASGDFTQTNDCGSTLLAGASCTIYVIFTPTVVGNRTGTVSVTSNVTGSPHTVSMSGSGAAVPGAPTGVSATTSNASVRVSFAAPASNGGSTITGYTVTSSPGDITASGASSPISVAGLAEGTAYTFTVTATNAIGTSVPSSASNAVTLKFTTSTTLVSSDLTVKTGDIFTLTAQVAGGNNPGGTVDFYENTKKGYKYLCSKVALSTGTAVCSVPGLLADDHSLYASYSGDANHQYSYGHLSMTIASNKSKGFCADLPAHTEFKAALAAGKALNNGGDGNHVWGVLVDRTGIVCAVAYSGNSLSAQALEGRVRAAQLAYTANAFSVDLFALSSANLYNASQPGGSLFGLAESQPLDATLAYGTKSSSYGQANDPLVKKRVGGVLPLAGGLALKDTYGRMLGAIGIAGDTPCASHNLAWQVRHALSLDHMPTMGVNTDTTHPDNIIYMGHESDPAEVPYSHPECSADATAASAALPVVRE